MTTSGDKLSALVLAVVMVFSVFAGTIAFSGAALGAGNAGNVSLSVGAAGNQATVTVEDGDLNADSGAAESLVVNVESDSEGPPTGEVTTGSDTSDGSTQTVSVSPTTIVADRNNDNKITKADFTLKGASDEIIKTVADRGSAYDVTIEDAGGTQTDGNAEEVVYTKLPLVSTSVDTDSGSPVEKRTTQPVGDRNGDGSITAADFKAVRTSDDESITNVAVNPDGTVTLRIADSNNDGDDAPERFRYHASETATLTETGPDTGTFQGSFSIVQSDSNGVLEAVGGDTIRAIYWDDGGSTRRTATAIQPDTDTTSPSISNVTLSGSGGDMAISFDSDEQLGGSASDVAVTVTGPNGATYSFDRTDFAESPGGPPYTYTLATTQAYDDGDGSYSVAVIDARDSAGNNGGLNGEGSGLTDTYSFSSGGGGGNTFINGTVRNSSGSPIDGVTVVAVPPSGSETITQTNTDGNYSLSVSANTRYEVIADDHPDHQFEVKENITVSASSTKVVDFQLKAFPDDGTLDVTVEDSVGNPISGATVSARELGFRFGGSATTNGNGVASLSLPASNYFVRAQSPQNVNAAPKTLENVTIRAGQTTTKTIRLSEPAYITGTVTDASGTVESGVGVVADSGGSIQYSPTNQSGVYNITVPPGNYTVSVFTQNADSDSKEITASAGNVTRADFTLRSTDIKHSSVEVIDNGSGVDTGNLGIATAVRGGMLQVKLTNQSGGGSPGPGIGGPPDELEGLGVSENTRFRINITVTNFTASSLMWGIRNARWSTSDNATVTNGTDITVEGTPVQLQVKFSQQGGGAETGVGPLLFQDPSQVSWSTGRDDQATDGRNKTVYFGVFDLDNMPGRVQNNLQGMSVTTNAQRFSTPSVVNQSLRVWVAAPTKTVAGSDHDGFYQAEIPQSQLDEWGVDNPESELNALYKGDPANFTVTNTSSGARILLENISYSAGFAEIQANPGGGSDSSTSSSGSSSSSGGGGGGGGGGGSADPTRTEVTVETTDSGATATIAGVSPDDRTVSFPVNGVSTNVLSVTDVSVTFDRSTTVPNTVSVSARSSKPSAVPTPPSDDVLGYVSVDVEGVLQDEVAHGSFTVDVSSVNGADVPENVVAYRYHEGVWERIETEPVDNSTVKIVTPGYSWFAIAPASPARQSTPAVTPTPTTTRTPTASGTATPQTPTGTIEVTTETPTDGPETPGTTPTPVLSRTPSPTGTPGASGPGFGVVAAVLAVVAAVGLARLRR